MQFYIFIDKSYFVCYITVIQYYKKGVYMVATVRLDDTLEKTLEGLSSKLHKKKSDIIRDAITFYANNIETNKQNKLRLAVEKTKEADKRIYDDMDGTLSDGI